MPNTIKNNIESQVIIKEKIYKNKKVIKVRKYLRGRFLGKGGFARCHEVVCLETKNVYAAKIIEKSGLKKSRTKQKLISEIKIHQSLKHKSIVKFEHFFEDTENVYILLEICKNKSLKDILKRRKAFYEIEVIYYIYHLVLGIYFLEKRN